MTRKTIETVTVLEFVPEWMKFAAKGEKINAIKSLRDMAGVDYEARLVSLMQSKAIVENFMAGLKTFNRDI